MTSPDSQARTLRSAIERQKAAQDAARDAARQIAAERRSQADQGEEVQPE
jgi:hypothetical protein